ncbi:MAG TPA: alpha/beta hydrolase [Candidatus Angelobacter sp.]|nr:alpha/beta hydrolase [Candidatus Angelobacter sp.]
MPDSSQLTPQSNWLELDGLRIHYQRLGSGPPLLLLHGLLGGSFCWRSNLAALSRQYTVIAVDLPGAGLSDAPPSTDCGMACQSARLAQFIRTLQLAPVTVIATSWGGAVALRLAIEDSALELSKGSPASPQIRALVLAAPANPWSSFGRRRIAFLNTAPGGWLLRTFFPISMPLHALALRRMYADPRRVTGTVSQGYARQIVRPGRAQNALSTLRHWQADMEVLRACIDKISVPVLLINGEEDRAVDPASLLILRSHLRHCEHVPLPSLGHLPFEEDPEQFNPIVLKFLQTVPT